MPRRKRGMELACGSRLPHDYYLLAPARRYARGERCGTTCARVRAQVARHCGAAPTCARSRASWSRCCSDAPSCWRWQLPVRRTSGRMSCARGRAHNSRGVHAARCARTVVRAHRPSASSRAAVQAPTEPGPRTSARKHTRASARVCIASLTSSARVARTFSLRRRCRAPARQRLLRSTGH